MDEERLLPTGECWCGCGDQTRIGSFFLPGHDRAAEAAVVKTKYGGVPAFLKAHGFGPGGVNARAALDRWNASQERSS